VFVFVFRPDPDEGLRLKNESAERVVPVHPELVRCGFPLLCRRSGRHQPFRQARRLLEPAPPQRRTDDDWE
jgi:hypothetical protein